MASPFCLKDKTIIITGASSGIGRQCAISCSEMGANIILIARNKERLDNVLIDLKDGNHASYILDLQNFDSYSNTFKNIVDKHGKISGLIHSAGIEASIPLNALKGETYKNVYEINTFSFFEIVRFFSKKKNVVEGASFVAISSIMGVLGQKGKLAYCSSKSALINGVKALALELAEKKIRVNSVSPAVVETPMVSTLFSNISPENKTAIEEMHPLGIGQPVDVSNACIYLLSEASKWVTGTNLIIDGGYSAH